MSTKTCHPLWRLLLPILLTLCFWCLMVMLALYFTGLGAGGGSGSGLGTGGENGMGHGSSLANGSGAASEGTGKGASEADARGGNPESLASQDTPGQVKKKTGTPAVVSNDSRQEAKGDEGEDVDLSSDAPEFTIGTSTVIKPRPVGTKTRVPQTGKVVMSGSEAGKLKGFFGSGGVKGNVMFVLDVSGSMDGNTPEGIRRINLLKREFKKFMEEKKKELANPAKGGVLSGPKAGNFMIITFSEAFTFFPADKTMLSFSRVEDLNKALHFVDGLQSCGGTDMQGVWNVFAPLLRPNSIDWIYLLSDGECEPGDLLKKYRNISPRMNTFSLGVRSQFMEEVAKQHRGRYYEIY